MTNLADVPIAEICLVVLFLIPLEQIPGDVILLLLIGFISFFLGHDKLELTRLFYFGPVLLVIRPSIFERAVWVEGYRMWS